MDMYEELAERLAFLMENLHNTHCISCTNPVFSSVSGWIVYILVVVIGLVLIFKTQINTLLNNIFKQINNKSKEVY